MLSDQFIIVIKLQLNYNYLLLIECMCISVLCEKGLVNNTRKREIFNINK